MTMQDAQKYISKVLFLNSNYSKAVKLMHSKTDG